MRRIRRWAERFATLGKPLRVREWAGGCRRCGVANRGQRWIGIVETDMATLAAGRMAVADLEGLLLRLGCRRMVTAEDAQRMARRLQEVGAGYEVVEKYLQIVRALDFA